MKSARAAIAVLFLAVNALCLAPIASAAPVVHGGQSASPADHSRDAGCRKLRHGVWWCSAVDPVPVYRDNAQITDNPFRNIAGGGFETNCKNDSGHYSGPGPHPHRWVYTTYLGAGGWVPDSKIKDNADALTDCPPGR